MHIDLDYRKELTEEAAKKAAEAAEPDKKGKDKDKKKT